MSDKLQEYKNRQREWRDISVTQLSNTNNILLTLASGLFIFGIEKSELCIIYIDFSFGIDWLVATFWSSIFLLGLSILYGVGVLLCRLYDFRISRHIALTRQRFLSITKKNCHMTKNLAILWQTVLVLCLRLCFSKFLFLLKKKSRLKLTK